MKANYVMIENKGEVHPLAFKGFGTSRKRGDESTIGQFGTGNKHATALFIRTGVDFYVYAGEEKINFTIITEKWNKDGTEMNIDFIGINGVNSYIDINLGREWDVWMAIREIYSNALDEGEAKIENVSGDEITGKEGYTRMYIENTGPVKDVFDNFDSYFSMKREVTATMTYDFSSFVKDPVGDDRVGIIDIMEKKIVSNINHPAVIYRKGIRAIKTYYKSVFDYNISHIDFTNDARLIDINDVKYVLADGFQSLSPKMLEKVILMTFRDVAVSNVNDLLECAAFKVLSIHSLSDSYVEALKDYTLIPREIGGFFGKHENGLYLPSLMLEPLQKKFGDKLNFVSDTQDSGTINKMDVNVEHISVFNAILAKLDGVINIKNIKLVEFASDFTLFYYDKNNGTCLVRYDPDVRTLMARIIKVKVTSAAKSYVEASARTDKACMFVADLVLDQRILKPQLN